MRKIVAGQLGYTKRTWCTIFGINIEAAKSAKQLSDPVSVQFISEDDTTFEVDFQAHFVNKNLDWLRVGVEAEMVETITQRGQCTEMMVEFKVPSHDMEPG